MTWTLYNIDGAGLLWQSAAMDSDPTEAKAKGIDMVVDLEGTVDLVTGLGFAFGSPPYPEYVYYPLQDNSTFIGSAGAAFGVRAMAKHVWRKLLDGHKMLVHCKAGINRASLVNARTLMYWKNMNGTQAVAWVRAHRTGALTNQTFVDWLVKGG